MSSFQIRELVGGEPLGDTVVGVGFLMQAFIQAVLLMSVF